MSKKETLEEKIKANEEEEEVEQEEGEEAEEEEIEIKEVSKIKKKKREMKSKNLLLREENLYMQASMKSRIYSDQNTVSIMKIL